MQTEQHIWRTDDGRHVPAGHPDAAVLAYAAGDPVPDEVLDELTSGTKPGGKVKARRRPADKAKDQGEDKSGSGLTINRLADQELAKTEDSPGTPDEE